MHLVFENYDTRILASIRNERICSTQDDIVAISRIQLHQRLTTRNPPGPSSDNISKLEHRVVGNSIKIMVAINQTGQPLLDYVEERVKR